MPTAKWTLPAVDLCGMRWGRLSTAMKQVIGILAWVALLLIAGPSQAQESVCDLFRHLKAADGSQVIVNGELIISKDFAALGASDCDNNYETALGSNFFQQWPTALRLRPSPNLPAK